MTISCGRNCSSFTAENGRAPCDGGDVVVEVSPLETRKFRAITLPNKMKVLLVSDSSSDKAAAALNVGVGHFSDPWELPGLAHFCEHMLFLGTAKYPDEDSYRAFLAENSGYSNAYTSLEDTNYHFQLLVPSNDLESDDENHIPRFKEALDRFSQFFIEPLFTESATERELNAVDSEHQKNLQRDANRIFQLNKSCCNPQHPNAKFSTGSKATLGTDAAAAGLDTRKALLSFHKQYYSANLMGLCIMGPYSLDVLEDWVLELFSAIPNHDAPHPSTEYKDIDLLLPEQTCHITYVDPIKDIRRLEISWVTPGSEIAYMSKPSHYISHILGHEGKGSLLSLLKLRGWADGLASGAGKDITPVTFFSISIDLTMEGTKHVDEVIELLFGFLSLVRECGVQKWIFDENASLCELNFRFQERCEPYSFVQNMTSMMHKYPPAHYMSGPCLIREYDPKGIHEILDIMTPNKCNVTLIGKFVKNKATLEERWYKTPYGRERIAEEKLQRWSRAKPDDGVGIPPKNMFVPTNFTMLAEPLPSSEKDMEGPKVIEENEFFELHYKLDRTFNRPKAAIHMELHSNVAYLNPRNALLTKAFTWLLTDALNEFSYDADIAGLHYNLVDSFPGLRLIVLGYNHKLDILLNTILDKMANFKADPERFDMVLDQLRRKYLNFDKEQPHSHAQYSMSYVLEHPRWHVHQYLDVLNSGEITVAAVDEFVQQLFSRLYVVGMIVGNVDAEWSKNAMLGMQKKFGYTRLSLSERNARRIVKLPTEYETVIRHTHPNPNDNNSAVQVLFQFGPIGDLFQDVTLELLAEILNKPAFHELRTVQQLGYMVFEGMTRYEGIRALYFVVQSPIAGPDELVVRIKQFLVDVRKDTLETMSEDEFGAYVSSLCALKTEREKNLFRQTGRFWSEILLRSYIYDREEQEARVLQTVTKKDMLAMFDKYVAEEGTEHRCFISMVHGNLHTRPERGATPQLEGTRRPVIEIEDPIAFRHWCPTFPVTGASLADVVKVPKF